jgi:hypothetical protein
MEAICRPRCWQIDVRGIGEVNVLRVTTEMLCARRQRTALARRPSRTI